MKKELLSLLVCPHCQCRFNIHSALVDGTEIMEGTLVCAGCYSRYPIVRGIPRFLPNRLTAAEKATAEAFGYEWTHYSKLTDADRKEFLGWISPLTPDDFQDRVVLDAGCGKGRHVFLAAQFKARTVVGVDLSNAVEAAYRNTRGLPNAHIVQAGIGCLPFAHTFDLVYSIGVLHHLPVPGKGFLALAQHVRPGGRISAWVYGKEGNLWIEKMVDPVRRNLTSRLPKPVTRFLSFFPALALYAALKIAYRPATRIPWLKRLLPYSGYLCSISDYSFAENFWNVFDQLVAPTAFYHTREEVVGWFKAANAGDVVIQQHNGNSWRGTGLVPARTHVHEANNFSQPADCGATLAQ
jgi:SAM-dependent methyltransferase